jgi:uncharacterized membrane protein
VNLLGEIVGETYGASGTAAIAPGHAFLYSGGTTTRLPSPNAGAGDRACGINAYGQIAGDYFVEGGVPLNPFSPPEQQGIIWRPTAVGGSSFTYTWLGSGQGTGPMHPGPSDPTCAYAINRDGLAVGYGFTTHHAFLWVPQTVNGATSGATPETLYDLGVLTTTTGDRSDAYAISSPTLVSGTGTATIVGKDTLSSSSKAVKWTVSYTVNPSTQAITVNSVSSVPTDLNTLGAFGWTLQSATGVNSSNAVVGYGTNPSGHLDAFLLQ